MRLTTNQNFACWLALGVMVFSSLWCCCLPKAVAAQSASTADSQIVSTPGHSCCATANAAQDASTSQPAPSQSPEPASCNCERHLMQPDAPVVYAPVACPANDLPAFDLAMITAAWALPVEVDNRPPTPQSSPPPAVDQSLLSLSCLLTI